MRAINYPLSSRVRSSPREIFYLPYSVFSGDCKKKMGLGQIFSAVEGWGVCQHRPSATEPDAQSIRRAAVAGPKAIARWTLPLLSASRLPARPLLPLGVSRCLLIRFGQPALHHSLLPYSVLRSLGRPSLHACRGHPTSRSAIRPAASRCQWSALRVSGSPCGSVPG